MVKIVPVASEVEAEPMVCDRFASRIVDLQAQRPEGDDRHHRGRDRGGDRHADPETEIGVGGAEDDAEHDAGEHGLEGELRDRLPLRAR